MNLEGSPVIHTVSMRGAALLAFILVLGLGYLFSEFAQFPVSFVFMLTETGELAVFSTKLGEILEIVTWSFGLPVAGYFLLHVNIQKWKGHGIMPETKERALLATFMIATIMIACGNIVHVFFNQYNNMVEGFAGLSPGAWNLFVLVYFIDEHVSHAMVHLGILVLFGAILGAEPVECLPGELTRSKKRTTILAMVLGLVMGVIQAFSALEGQSALVNLVASWSMLAILLVVHFKRGNRGFKTLRPLERINLGFFLCTIVATTVVVLAWGSIVGSWPFYPFFKQPGEVFP
nr:hypothetical protein [Candidatus Sigynarchaeota archaeon]